MYFEEVNGLKVGRFVLLSKNKNVFFAFSTRIGGVSAPPFEYLNLGLNCGDSRVRVLENRHRFFNALGINQNRLAVPEQVHGAHVQRITEPGFYEKTDGLVTNSPGVFLSISVADCVPIFYFDPCRKAIGVAHAGWRGTKEEVAKKTLGKMVEEFGTEPKDVLVFIGPYIGSCCYAVEGKNNWNKDFLKKGDARHQWYLDLWAANRRQVVTAGVKEEHIVASGFCTNCNRRLFYSYRGEKGKTGRMLGIIGLRE